MTDDRKEYFDPRPPIDGLDDNVKYDVTSEKTDDSRKPEIPLFPGDYVIKDKQ